MYEYLTTGLLQFSCRPLVILLNSLQIFPLLTIDFVLFDFSLWFLQTICNSNNPVFWTYFPPCSNSIHILLCITNLALFLWFYSHSRLDTLCCHISLVHGFKCRIFFPPYSWRFSLGCTNCRSLISSFFTKIYLDVINFGNSCSRSLPLILLSLIFDLFYSSKPLI